MRRATVHTQRPLTPVSQLGSGSDVRSSFKRFFKSIIESIFILGGKVISSDKPALKVIESSSETEVDSFHHSQSSTSSLGGTKSKWETVVVVAVNLSRLDMSTNMGSVMGQTL